MKGRQGPRFYLSEAKEHLQEACNQASAWALSKVIKDVEARQESFNISFAEAASEMADWYTARREHFCAWVAKELERLDLQRRQKEQDQLKERDLERERENAEQDPGNPDDFKSDYLSYIQGCPG